MLVDQLFDVKGNAAVVTGASSGLGQVFADTLASKGANLALCARRVERVEAFASKLERAHGIKALALKVDVTDEGQLSGLMSKAYSEYGRIDILVNNAGTAAEGPSLEMGMDDFQKVIDTNLVAAFAAAREAAKHMMKRGYGKVINIASIYGAVGDVFPAAPYYASKGGVVNMTRALAVEWAPSKICVNAIGPGFFPSEMTKEAFADPKTMEYVKSRTPMRRTGSVDDLRGALMLLASHASDYITGQTIFVDGGWTAW